MIEGAEEALGGKQADLLTEAARAARPSAAAAVQVFVDAQDPQGEAGTWPPSTVTRKVATPASGRGNREQTGKP